MNEQSEADRLRAQGLTDVETVGDILERTSGDEPGIPPNAPFAPPRLEGYTPPVALQPGIHFGLPEEAYHAFPALSNHGIKEIAASPMIFWTNSRWLNPDWEEPEEKAHFNLGHAYECRILEGEEAFNARYATELDRKDYPDALVTSQQMKDWLEEHCGVKAKGTSKAGFMDQIREWKPDAQSWDELVLANAEANEGKTILSAKAMRKIAITARIVELDPEHKAAVTGGFAQVTLVWHCAKTGVLMKARLDYLKLRAILDAKTMANQNARSPEAAAFNEIANRKYTIQPSVYLEGAEAVKALIREHGASVIFSHDLDCDEGEEMTLEEQELHYQRVQWAMRWAAEKGRIEWLWLFCQTAYPITRLLRYPVGGVNKSVSDEIVSRMKRRFKRCAEEFGALPWLDLEGMVEMSDEDIRPYALEI